MPNEDEDYDWTEDTERAIGGFILQFASVEYVMRYVLCEVAELSLRWMRPVVTHDFALYRNRDDFWRGA